MKLSKSLAGLGIVALAFCAASTGLARTQAPSPPPASQQGGAPAEAATAPAATKKEDDAYRVILEARSGPPMHLISLGEAFIADFPASAYAGNVDALLTGAYLQTGQTGKMMDAGTKALASNPDNVDVLAIVAWATSRDASAATPEGQQILQWAAGYARRAMDLLGTMTKPDRLDAATFAREKNEDLSKCHSALGVIAAKSGNYAQAAVELTQAIHLAATPSMVDYYLLGVAEEETGQFAGAQQDFSRCAVDGSPVQSQCKNGMSEAIRKARAGSQGQRTNK